MTIRVTPTLYLVKDVDGLRFVKKCSQSSFFPYLQDRGGCVFTICANACLFQSKNPYIVTDIVRFTTDNRERFTSFAHLDHRYNRAISYTWPSVHLMRQHISGVNYMFHPRSKLLA